MGDVTVADEGRRGKIRRLRITIDSPGYGLRTQAIFEYIEWYERADARWRLERYAYELRPEPRPSRRAHHSHRPLGTHQHCLDPRRPKAPHHFEGFDVVLEQAHEEFRALAAAGRISCAGLRPLRPSADDHE
ncbi:MAG: hypothetical protein AAB284_07335 [Chloroflexota bacterium]